MFFMNLNQTKPLLLSQYASILNSSLLSDYDTKKIMAMLTYLVTDKYYQAIQCRRNKQA